MKFNIRWQLTLAVVGFGLILALLSFQVKSAGLCSIQLPAAGGIFVEGIVGAPEYLNPLLSDGYPVDQEIINLIFDGLTVNDATGKPAPALAQSWSISEDGRSVRFILRRDVSWHDGEPFTAEDVAFTYGLLQEDAFPGPAALKALWQSVTIEIIDSSSIEFNLAEPYAPFIQATTRGILPAHLLQGVTAANLAHAAFNDNPVGTGPFMIIPGQDWRRTQRLRLTPNPVQWRQGTKINGVEFRFFPDQATLLRAFETGDIHAINRVDVARLPAIAAMPGARLFTAPAPTTTVLLFNLTDSASPPIRDVDVRRALAYAVDRPALRDEVLNGQAIPLEGPFPSTSWAYNPLLLTLYESRPLSATALLESSGWLQLAEGATRVREGRPLELRLLALAGTTNARLAEAIAAQWSKVGVSAQLTRPSDPAQFRQALADRQFDAAIVNVSLAGDPDLYDFWSQEAILEGQGYAGWNNRRASEALENGRREWDFETRRTYYDAFLRYFDEDLPALTLFQQVRTYALSAEVNQADVGRIDQARDRFETFADWFLLYREVTVSCPGAESA